MTDGIRALNDDELSEISGGAYSGACFVYVIQKGDALSTIAMRYNTTVQELIELNDLKSLTIYEGNKLLVPYAS